MGNFCSGGLATGAAATAGEYDAPIWKGAYGGVSAGYGWGDATVTYPYNAQALTSAQ